MNIFNRIIQNETNNKKEDNNIIQNSIETILNTFKNSNDNEENNDNEKNEVIIENKKIINNENNELKENTFENILNEMQEHEIAMENAIKNADELANATKDSIMYYLNIRKPNKHGILFQGVPDALNASARLLDLSISGRYKLASMKKLRASILKELKDGNSNDFNLMSILNED